MGRSRIATAASGALLAATLLTSCAPSVKTTSRPLPIPATVRVTAYSAVSPALGSRNPVSVVLSRTQAARLAAMIATLGRAPRGFCHEDPVLYTITATASPRGAVAWRASADVCPGALRITGPRLIVRSDRSCALAHFIDGLFPPGEARGTRAYAFVCSQHGSSDG